MRTKASRLSLVGIVGLFLGLVPVAYSGELATPSAGQEVCMTAAQFNRLSRFPIKKDCILPKGTDQFCAAPACVGQVAQGDFDGDGQMDQAFTLQMSEPGDEEYWAVFASVSSYRVILRASGNDHMRPEAKSFLQTTSAQSSGHPFAGWGIVAGETGNAQTYGFDAKKRAFVSAEDDGGDPGRASPGIGLSLLVGTSSTFGSIGLSGSGVSNSPGLGFQGGARLDGYLSRYFSLETGVAWESQSFKTTVTGVTGSGTNITVTTSTVTFSFNTLQFPVQLKIWPIPGLFFGGGIVYTQAIGQMGCSASGTGAACTSASVDYSQTGLKSSYVSWLAALGLKARLGKGRFWVVGELELSGTPNLVQDATQAGTSSFSYVEFQSYGGIRYTLFGAKD